MPIQSVGYIQAVTRGYFVMLILHPGEEYYIDCKATGMTTEKGPYQVSFFYHIKVNKPSNPRVPEILPKRLNTNIAIKVYDKYDKGQLTPSEYDQIMGYLDIEFDGKTKKIIGERKNK